ncbi:MAG: hypothetical protein PF448_08750 [Bacteroidales bacterium]|jgi:hypothetical protein|nr:hypothetical protein [Bacteroidales bacterium]
MGFGTRQSIDSILLRNVMSVDPSLEQNEAQHLFKTYAAAKKYILDNLDPASNTNKYLIRLPAGEINAAVAGTEIVGEEGCVHLEANIILSCNDATVVTCPLKSNGLVADLMTEGFSYLFAFYINGGIFKSIEGTGNLFSFSNSLLSGFNLDSCGLYMNDIVVSEGFSIDTLMFLSYNSTFEESFSLSISKDAFTNRLIGCNGAIELVNPSDTSAYAEIVVYNSEIIYVKNNDTSYYYSFDFKNSNVSFDGEFNLTVYGDIHSQSSIIKIEGDIVFTKFVYDYNGTITSNGSNLTFENSAYLFNLEIIDVTLNLNNAAAIINVRGLLTANLFNITAGILSINNPEKIIQIVADAANYEVLPGTLQLNVANTPVNAQTIVLKDYMKSPQLNLFIADTDDASINNITIEDGLGNTIYTINAARGYVNITYSEGLAEFIAK